MFDRINAESDYANEIERIVGKECELVDFVSYETTGTVEKSEAMTTTNGTTQATGIACRLYESIIRDLAQPLLEDEISVHIFQVGVFSIRISKVVCKDYPIIWKDRISISKEKIQKMRLNHMLCELRSLEAIIEQELHDQCEKKICESHSSCSAAYLHNYNADYRIETVVSACMNEGPADANNYQFICHAQEDWHGWCEKITWIGAIKTNDTSKQDVLLVKKDFCGDSHQTDHWYQYRGHDYCD